jgi:hypothetical protein
MRQHSKAEPEHGGLITLYKCAQRIAITCQTAEHELILVGHENIPSLRKIPPHGAAGFSSL